MQKLSVFEIRHNCAGTTTDNPPPAKKKRGRPSSPVIKPVIYTCLLRAVPPIPLPVLQPPSQQPPPPKSILNFVRDKQDDRISQLGMKRKD